MRTDTAVGVAGTVIAIALAGVAAGEPAVFADPAAVVAGPTAYPLLVAGVSTLVVFAGLAVLLGPGWRRPPDLEAVERAVDERGARVGSDRDALLAAYRDRTSAPVPDEVRAELRAVVTALVAERDDCSRDDARERVLAGEWTDDRYVAALLADADGPTAPLADRVRDWLRAEPGFLRQLDRTTDEIAELTRDLDGREP